MQSWKHKWPTDWYRIYKRNGDQPFPYQASWWQWRSSGDSSSETFQVIFIIIIPSIVVLSSALSFSAWSCFSFSASSFSVSLWSFSLFWWALFSPLVPPPTHLSQVATTGSCLSPASKNILTSFHFFSLLWLVCPLWTLSQNNLFYHFIAQYFLSSSFYSSSSEGILIHSSESLQ